MRGARAVLSHALAGPGARRRPIPTRPLAVNCRRGMFRPETTLANLTPCPGEPYRTRESRVHRCRRLVGVRVPAVHPPPTTEQVSRTTGQSLAEVRAAVDRLRELGLVETGPGSSDEILPVPPDSALLPALRRWESQLDRTRQASDGLIHRWRRRNRRHEDLIQTVGESDSRLGRLRATAGQRHGGSPDLRPAPYVAPPSGNPAQLDAMGRGVVYRTVYTQEALSDEVRQNLARAAIAAW